MYQWIHLSPLTTPAPFLLSPTSHYFNPKNSSRLDPIGSNTQNAMRRWPRKKRNIFKRAMDMRGDMTVQADTRENVSVQAPCHCHSSSVRLLLLLTDPSCGIYNHPANTAPTSFHKTPAFANPSSGHHPPNHKQLNLSCHIMPMKEER